MQAPPTTVKMPQLQQQSSIRSPEDRIGGQSQAFNYNDEGSYTKLITRYLNHLTVYMLLILLMFFYLY